VDLSFAIMGAGNLHLLPLPQLLATLKTVCPAADTYSVDAAAQSLYAPSSVPAGSSSSSVVSLAAHSKFIESFPGPLSSSSSKEKVQKFLRDRLEGYLQEERLADAPSWQVCCECAGGVGGGVCVSDWGMGFGIAGLCVGAWVIPLTEVPEGEAGGVSAGGGPG
jgi:hypothetical protein